MTREEAKRVLEFDLDHTHNNESKEALRMAIKALEQEPKVGHWKKGDYWSDGCGMGENYGYYYECSNCGETVQDGYLKCSYNYCPYCGCRMVEPQEREGTDADNQT